MCSLPFLAFIVLSSSQVLGVYLTTSEAQDADVECFESADSQVVLDEQAASCTYSIHTHSIYPLVLIVPSHHCLPQSTPTNSNPCTVF